MKTYLAIKIAEFSAKEKKITPKNFNGIRGTIVEFHGIKGIQGKRKILQLEVSENENEFFDDSDNNSLLRKARDHHEPILLEFQEIDYNEESQVATLKEVKIFRELESWFPDSQPEAEKINSLISEPKKQSEIIAEKKKSYENFQREKAEFLWSLSNEKLCAETGFTKEGLGDTDILHPNGAALRNYLYRQKFIKERSESHQTFIISSKSCSTFEQRKKILVKFIVSKFVLDKISWEIVDDEEAKKFSGYILSKVNHRGVKNFLTENEREKIVESEEFSKLEIEELWEFQKFLSFLNALYELAKKEKRKIIFNNYLEPYKAEKKRRWKEFHNLIDKELDGLATKLTTDFESASQYIESIENISESIEKEEKEKVKKLDLFIEEVNKLIELDIKQTEDIGIIEKVSEDSVKIKIVILEDDKEYFPLVVEKIKEEIIKKIEKNININYKSNYKTKISRENNLDKLLNIIKEVMNQNDRDTSKGIKKLYSYEEREAARPEERMTWDEFFVNLKKYWLTKIKNDCQKYCSFVGIKKIDDKEYCEYWNEVAENLIDYQSEEIEEIIDSLLPAESDKHEKKEKQRWLAVELTRLKEKPEDEKTRISEARKEAWKTAYRNNIEHAQKSCENGWIQLEYSNLYLNGGFPVEGERKYPIHNGEIKDFEIEEEEFISIKTYEIEIDLLIKIKEVLFLIDNITTKERLDKDYELIDLHIEKIEEKEDENPLEDYKTYNLQSRLVNKRREINKKFKETSNKRDNTASSSLPQSSTETQTTPLNQEKTEEKKDDSDDFRKFAKSLTYKNIVKYFEKKKEYLNTNNKDSDSCTFSLGYLRKNQEKVSSIDIKDFRSFIARNEKIKTLSGQELLNEFKKIEGGRKWSSLEDSLREFLECYAGKEIGFEEIEKLKKGEIEIDTHEEEHIPMPPSKSGPSPLFIGLVVIAVFGIFGSGWYFIKKRKKQS